MWEWPHLLLVGAGIPALAITAFIVGWLLAKRIDQAKIGDAEEVARRLVEGGRAEAKNIRQAVDIEIKTSRLDFEEELRREADKKRGESLKNEVRLNEREAKLDQRAEDLDSRNGDLNKRHESLDARSDTIDERSDEIESVIAQQNERLETIAGMTSEDARDLLIANMETRARKDGAHKAKDIRDKATRDAEREAREIVGQAIQRFAGEHTTETTVSVVQLPNEEMKGRIIGREGRNIRAFEMATGVDVIVDDTPEAVILSGFDCVRREVARIAMQKLVDDGRIHPGRIEELVERAQKEVEDEIQRAGEEAVYDLGIHDMHPALVKILGKLKYRTSFGQNVLQHAREVGILTGLMAEQLGIDPAMCRRAGLLHDIGKAIDRENEGTHVELGVDLARKYGEPEDVLAAIATHHDDIVVDSMLCVLVHASDAISSARPGARRETIEGYVKRLERLESIAQAFDGVEKTFAIQAGREVRVMVSSERLDDSEAEQLAMDIAEKIQADMEYPGQIKVVVIRETRKVAYAK
jgi:ribonucrease Y